MNKAKILLAIETSCDETAAAVLEMGGKNVLPKTLSSVVKSQIKLHSKMGGVVPEAAARAHVKYIRPVVEKALLSANYKLSSVNYLAVTQGPGLLPSLMVGVEFAKALAFAAKKPIIPVNHMLGHLYSPFNQSNSKSKILNLKSVFPMVSLIVSGGHTMLVLMENIKDYRVLGQTVDDAAGEAFDKVAKMLKLPYPGGPEVSKLAAKGNPRAIEFPRPMLHSKDYNFSFSGLKTAVLYFLQSNLKSEILNLKSDVCAGFQAAVIDVLVTKTMRAVKQFGAKSVSLSGGVAANTELRKTLSDNCKLKSINFFVPPVKLCTDNAEMIGLAAAFMLKNGKKPVAYQKIEANPNLTL